MEEPRIDAAHLRDQRDDTGLSCAATEAASTGSAASAISTTIIARASGASVRTTPTTLVRKRVPILAKLLNSPALTLRSCQFQWIDQCLLGIVSKPIHDIAANVAKLPDLLRRARTWGR
jgi:hypothetical protein